MANFVALVFFLCMMEAVANVYKATFWKTLFELFLFFNKNHSKVTFKPFICCWLFSQKDNGEHKK